MVLNGNMDRQNRRSSLDSLLDDRLHHVREGRAATCRDAKDGNRLTCQCLLPPTSYRLGYHRPEGDATHVAGQTSRDDAREQVSLDASVDRVVGAPR